MVPINASEGPHSLRLPSETATTDCHFMVLEVKGKLRNNQLYFHHLFLFVTGGVLQRNLIIMMRNKGGPGGVMTVVTNLALIISGLEMEIEQKKETCRRFHSD